MSKYHVETVNSTISGIRSHLPFIQVRLIHSKFSYATKCAFWRNTTTRDRTCSQAVCGTFTLPCYFRDGKYQTKCHTMPQSDQKQTLLSIRSGINGCELCCLIEYKWMSLPITDGRICCALLIHFCPIRKP